MTIEIHTVDALRRHLEAGHSLANVVCQGIDLSAEDALLTERCGDGAAFLGCSLSPAIACHLTATGALVFPRIPDLPFRPYRGALYAFDELLDGFDPARPESFFDATADAAIYAWSERHRATGDVPVLDALAQRLHDHAIDDALGDLLRGKKVVAIMGGHGMQRDEPAYRAVAEIGRELARAGRFVATGGGPGAMEAGNLGAWFSVYPDEALDHAVGVLAAAPGYRHPGYVPRALEVRERFRDGAESLAIPTWFYGHEPTNPFAVHIAKYFANSLREDGLLAIAQHGVVYAPGSAGTIQEVFMDACQNHYATFGTISPMVFFGHRFWTEECPVQPLLARLAADRPYGALIALEDDPRAVIAFLLAHGPHTPEGQPSENDRP